VNIDGEYNAADNKEQSLKNIKSVCHNITNHPKNSIKTVSYISTHFDYKRLHVSITVYCKYCIPAHDLRIRYFNVTDVTIGSMLCWK